MEKQWSNFCVEPWSSLMWVLLTLGFNRVYLQHGRVLITSVQHTCLLSDNPYFEEEFSPFFHDLLDLQEACSVHEEKLVPHCHAETTRVAEGQNLLKALRLHGWWKLHYSRAGLIAASTSTIAAEKVPEIRTASSQHSSMSLGQSADKKSVKRAEVCRDDQPSPSSLKLWHLTVSSLPWKCGPWPPRRRHSRAPAAAAHSNTLKRYFRSLGSPSGGSGPWCANAHHLRVCIRKQRDKQKESYA